MNRLAILAAALIILAGSFSALSQPGPKQGGPGPAGPAPTLSGAMLKMFGEHKAFSGDMQTQVKDSGSGQSMEMPGKIAVLNGKARLEMDMSQAKGSAIPPQAAAQMKMMGLSEMIMLTLPEKKESYLIYPGLKSYLALPSEESGGSSEADMKVQSTELGKEKIADHPTIKNKVVVTDGQNNKTEMVVWNATDLKNFPIRIQYSEDGRDSISTYTNIKFEKPAESLFTLPEGYTRYEDMGGLMRGAMQRLMGTAPNQPGKN